MSYNRAQMKLEVKRIMKQTRPRPIWLTLLYLVIAAAGSWVIQTVIGAVMGVSAITSAYTEALMNLDPDNLETVLEDLARMLVVNSSVLSGLISGSILMGILSYLWTSLMGMSYVGYTLDMVRGRNPGAKALFSAFPKFGKVILTNILVGVFTALWTLLFGLALVIVIVIAALLIESVPAIAILLMIVGYAAFLVVMLWVTLRYAMVNYLVMDQDLSGLEAIRVSKQMMKGYKGRLFVLQLSFIGWYLVAFAIILVGGLLMGLSVLLASGGSMGGIIVGVILMLVVGLAMVVGILLLEMWLTPYVGGSTVKFYEYIMSQRPDLFARQENPDAFGNPNYPTLE